MDALNLKRSGGSNNNSSGNTTTNPNSSSTNNAGNKQKPTAGRIATSSRVETSKSVLNALQTLQSDEELFHLDPAAKVALEILAVIQDISEGDIDEDLVALALDSCALIYVVINQTQRILDEEGVLSDRHRMSVVETTRLLEQICIFVKKRVSRKLYQRVWKHHEDESKAHDYIEAISKWPRVYGVEADSQATMHDILQQVIDDKLLKIDEEGFEARRLKRLQVLRASVAYRNFPPTPPPPPLSLRGNHSRDPSLNGSTGNGGNGTPTFTPNRPSFDNISVPNSAGMTPATAVQVQYMQQQQQQQQQTFTPNRPSFDRPTPPPPPQIPVSHIGPLVPRQPSPLQQLPISQQQHNSTPLPQSTAPLSVPSKSVPNKIFNAAKSLTIKVLHDNFTASNNLGSAAVPGQASGTPSKRSFENLHQTSSNAGNHHLQISGPIPTPGTATLGVQEILMSASHPLNTARDRALPTPPVIQLVEPSPLMLATPGGMSARQPIYNPSSSSTYPNSSMFPPTPYPNSNPNSNLNSSNNHNLGYDPQAEESRRRKKIEEERLAKKLEKERFKKQEMEWNRLAETSSSQGHGSSSSHGHGQSSSSQGQGHAQSSSSHSYAHGQPQGYSSSSSHPQVQGGPASPAGYWDVYDAAAEERERESRLELNGAMYANVRSASPAFIAGAGASGLVGNASGNVRGPRGHGAHSQTHSANSSVQLSVKDAEGVINGVGGYQHQDQRGYGGQQSHSQSHSPQPHYHTPAFVTGGSTSNSNSNQQPLHPPHSQGLQPSTLPPLQIGPLNVGNTNLNSVAGNLGSHDADEDERLAAALHAEIQQELEDEDQAHARRLARKYQKELERKKSERRERDGERGERSERDRGDRSERDRGERSERDRGDRTERDRGERSERDRGERSERDRHRERGDRDKGDRPERSERDRERRKDSRRNDTDDGAPRDRDRDRERDIDRDRDRERERERERTKPKRKDVVNLRISPSPSGADRMVAPPSANVASFW